MKVITKKNFFQASIGAFSSMLLFLALQAYSIVSIEELGSIPVRNGFIISVIWGFVLYQGLSQVHKEEFWFDLIVTFLVAGTLSYFLQLITIDILFSAEVFGSIVMPAVWIGLPMAIVFDKANVTSYIKTKFIRK